MNGNIYSIFTILLLYNKENICEQFSRSQISDFLNGSEDETFSKLLILGLQNNSSVRQRMRG
uniref:Uncharacterized protein n=1 Tax=Rhizophora mucronata TaxID=61149 RepID=A0A2P2QFY9_RHIMU